MDDAALLKALGGPRPIRRALNLARVRWFLLRFALIALASSYFIERRTELGWLTLVFGSLVAVIPAALTAMIDEQMEVLGPKMNYWLAQATRLICVVVSVGIGAFFGGIPLKAYQARQPVFSPGIWRSFEGPVPLGMTETTIFALGVTLFVVASLRRVALLIGPGELWRFLTGRYHQPRTERRVFLFMDLKGSTSIGEYLSPLQYSAFLRDFVNDISPAVLASGAHIVEYVGDEVVLTWPADRAVRRHLPLKMAAYARYLLHKRAPYYRATYGRVPEFKAAAHIGPCVGTVIGRLKEQVVFHGDVLNTTARIMSLCRPLQQDLLVSRELAEDFPSLPGLHPLFCGTYDAQGKAEPLPVYSFTDEPRPLPTYAVLAHEPATPGMDEEER